MAHGKNRIPYRIDRRLTGPAGPEYHAIISFGLPFESEDCQYGKSQIKAVILDQDPGDISTIEEEGSVEEARQAWQKMKAELHPQTPDDDGL